MTKQSGGGEPSPLLGLQPLQEATEVFGRATKDIVASQRKATRQLEELSKTLNTLAAVMGKSTPGGKTGGGPTGTGHSYGPIGGGASIGGQGYNGHTVGQGQHAPGGQRQQPGQPRQQPPKTPNGGATNFSFLGFNQQPSATAPGGFKRFATAWGGNTPRQWGTQWNTLEMSAQLGSHTLGVLGQRGLDQLDQERLGELMRAEEMRHGGSWSQAEQRGWTERLGTQSQTPGTLQQSFATGDNARSSIQNMQDLYSGEELVRRFSGGYATQAGQDRKNSLLKGSDALAYTNPTLSYTQTNQVMSNMLKPSNRLNMMLMGLPNPTDSSGAYVGNAAFFGAFLKRIYQGRESVPMNVFEDDFREGGVGLANLRMIVGEEGAEIMLPNLRAFNLAKSKGKDTSSMDRLMSEANTAGSKGDKARKTLESDFGLKDTGVHLGNRNRAQDLASEMSGNEEYLEAERASTIAMHTFAEAVHSFVNAPLIGDVANFMKGFLPSLMKVSDAAGGGALSILGSGPLISQGPIDDASGGGAAPLPGMSSSARKSDNIGAEIAKSATTYANGSRKYKYSMKYRNKDGFFDCSSFVSRVYKQHGYNVGPTTVQMWRQGESVDLDDVQPGDLVLWARGKPGAAGGAAEHVEMYIGNGKTVGTASAGPGQNTIQVQPYRPGDWDAARRIIGGKRGEPSGERTTDQGPDTGSGGSDDGGVLGKLGKAASDLFGGGGGAFNTAGTGSAVAGLGAGNAAAYSTSELTALMGILSGGSSGPGELVAGDGVTSSSDEEDVPFEAKGSNQSPDNEDAKKADQSKSGKLRLGKFRRDPNGRTTNYAPEKYPQPNINANKAVARGMMKSYGWNEEHWDELEKLWTRESSWNQYADNKGSDAYGIPQSLPGTKMSSAGKDWRTNPETQIKWGLGYIKGRYGTPTKAWAHSQAKGWYDSGAWQVQDEQEAIVHKGEMIIPSQQAQTIRDALIRENLGGKVTGNGGTDVGKDSSAKVEIHFAQGAIVMQFGSEVSASAGSSAARGFIKELERHELYKSIARGGGKRVRA